MLPNNTDVQIGERLARRFFTMRGNHSEMHLRESELAAMLAFAAELGRTGVMPATGNADGTEGSI